MGKKSKTHKIGLGPPILEISLIGTPAVVGSACEPAVALADHERSPGAPAQVCFPPEGQETEGSLPLPQPIEFLLELPNPAPGLPGQPPPSGTQVCEKGDGAPWWWFPSIPQTLQSPLDAENSLSSVFLFVYLFIAFPVWTDSSALGGQQWDPGRGPVPLSDGCQRGSADLGE